MAAPPTAASGSRHSVWYVVETEYGTTPATPAWTNIPYATCNINTTKDSIDVRYIRGDRQRCDIRHGNKTVSGDITFPLAYGIYDNFLEMLLGGTWATDVLKNGIERRSISVLRHQEDTGQFQLFTGIEANGYSFTVAPNTTVDFTFTVSGRDMPGGKTAAAPVGSTFNAVTDCPDAFDSFSGTITEGGSTIAVVTSVTPTLDNGITPLFVVGSDLTIRPSIGDAICSGSLETYVVDSVLYNKFFNETSSSLEVEMEDTLGNVLKITQPNIKYMSASNDVSSSDALTESLDYECLYNSGTTTTIQLDRTAA